MSVSGVLTAAEELQALVDPTNEVWKTVNEGMYLAIQNAVQKVYEQAKAFKESGAVSEEDDNEEDDGDWEDGDDTSAAELAERMVNDVRVDSDDFAEVVCSLYVHSLTFSRKPKAAALAIVQLLEDTEDADMLFKWKELFIALDGHGRCGYILKQNWLEDDFELDADPREAVLKILDLFSANDANFRERMRMRGNRRALKFIIDTNTETGQQNLSHAARVLLERLE